MAVLELPEGRLVTLAAHCVLGRSSACTVKLSDPRISGEHARITWRDQRWQIRDLGSRNGTFVNGTRLERGATAVLATGDKLAFGNAEVQHRILDDSPPMAVARKLSSGAMILAADDILALPSEARPELSVYQDPSGRWLLEHNGQVRDAADGEVVQLDGHAYMLHVPTGIPPTVEALAGPPNVHDLELRFRVSSNEEQVEVTLDNHGERTVIRPHAHHYTLLTLARLRLRDHGNGDIPEPARGWVTVDDLCDMLVTDETKLNVEIYRIRRDLSRAGVRNAASVIERQRGHRRLRLGVPRVAITSM